MTTQEWYQAAAQAQTATAQVSAELSRKQALEQIEKDREYNSIEAEKAREWSREERIASQEFNLDMWNRNNEYNSPVNQVKRMKEAGLNPNMLGSNPNFASSPVTTRAGSGASASNSSGASFVAPSMGQSAAMLTAIGNYQNQVAQSNKTAVETRWDEITFDKRLQNLDENIREIASRYNLNNEQTKQLEELNKWVASKSKAELDLILAKLNTEKENQWLISAQTLKTINEANKIGFEQASAKLDFNQKELEAMFSRETGIPYNANDFQLAYWLWSQDKFEDYVWFTVSKSGVDTGFSVIQDALDFINEIKSFKTPTFKGERTTTSSHGPKGSTYTTTETVPF